MRKFGNWLRWTAASLVFLPSAGFAATFSLSDITAGDYESIVKEFSSNFTFSTVTPASSLGGLGHFELGVVGGTTKSPALEALVKRADSTAKFQGKLYHGGPLVRIGLPASLTAEAIVFPTYTKSDVKFSEYAGSLMWTPTEGVLDFLPFSLAAKGFYSNTNVSYKQNVTSTVSGVSTVVNATIAFKDTIWGGTMIASKKILMFEPYAGLGYVHAKGTLSVDATGTVSIFNSSLTQSNEATTKPTSSQVLLGVDAQFAILALGLEYQRAFGQSSTNARLSFRF